MLMCDVGNIQAAQGWEMRKAMGWDSTLSLHGIRIQELAGGDCPYKCSAHCLITRDLVTHKQQSNSSFEKRYLVLYVVYASEKRRHESSILNGKEGARSNKKLREHGAKVRKDEMGSNFNSDFCCRL